MSFPPARSKGAAESIWTWEMPEKPQHLDPLSDPEREKRRAEARSRLDALDPAKSGVALEDPKRRDWFETVYELAEGDPVNVPWAKLAPHPLLVEWLSENPRLDGLAALDIGCGLGDNAAALAGQGAQVTAFDLVARAAEWARSRFPDLGIDFCAADLFAPPPQWRAKFDFVHETYTLQALPAEILAQAREAIAAMVRPGGRLLVIARARDAAQIVDGPPWPLSRADLEAFCGCGLTVANLEDIPARENLTRHWRALFVKPE